MLGIILLLFFSHQLHAQQCQPSRVEIGNVEVLQVAHSAPTDTVCLIKIELLNSFGKPHRLYVFDSRGHFLIIDDTANDESMNSLKFHSLVFLPAKKAPTFTDSKIILPNGDQLLLDTQTGIIDWKKSYSQRLTSILAYENEFTDRPGDILAVKSYPNTWLNYGALFGKPPESISNQLVAISSPLLKCRTQAKNFFIDGDFRYQSWSEERILNACNPIAVKLKTQ